MVNEYGLPHTGYKIEVGGFTREVTAGDGWQDRIRETVRGLTTEPNSLIRPGDEVTVRRIYGPLDGWHHVDTFANAHRLPVPEHYTVPDHLARIASQRRG